MILRRLLTIAILLTSTIWSQAQQINPVPDYVFRNQMSVGRNAVTDTGAYFSIGPRYGAVKGFMPPIVSDTAIVNANKRNGLLIFSVQKNKFLYWDSVRVQWSDMAGSSGSYITGKGITGYVPQFSDTATLDTSALYTLGNQLGVGTSSFAYTGSGRTVVELNGTAGGLYGFKRNDSAKGYLFHNGDNMELANTMAGSISFNTNSATRGSIASDGVWRLHNLAGTGDRVVQASSNGTLSATASVTGLVDTLTISTRAWRQKGIDSVVSIIPAAGVGGSGTTNYVAKFTAGSTIGNSQIFDNGTRVGIGTASPAAKIDVRGTGTQDIYLISTTATNVENSLQSYFNNGGAWADLSTKSQNLIFNTGPSGGPQAERLRITSGGDVLIGQQSDAFSTAGRALLGINGTSSALISLRYGGVSAGYIIGYSSALQINSNNIPIVFSTTEVERMRIFNNGRVGINTTTDAGYQLNVNGTFNSSANYSYFGGDANTAIYMGSFSNEGRIGVGGRSSFPTAAMTFYTADGTNNFERMRISSAGDMGIGTSSPSYKLDINGTLRSVSGANFATTSGQVGIGKTSPSAKSKLDVEGNIDIADGSFYYLRNAVANTGTYGMYYSNSAPKYPIRLAVNADPTNNRFFEIGWHKNDNKDSTWNPTFSVNSYNAETFINTTTDAGDYKLQVSGNIYNTGSAVLAATSGNVGVGTASPAAKTDISGTLRIGAASFVAPTSGAGMEFSYRTSDSTGYLTTYSRDYSGYRNQAFYALSQKFAYGTGGAIGLFLTSSGETLINTESDAGDYKLQVSGNIYNTGSAVLAATSGNVGVGTASPEAKFVISDGAGYRLAMRQWSGTGMEINAWNDAFQPTIPMRLNANYLTFNTGNPTSERGRINSAGEWIIDASGTDAGDYKLQVVGNARIGTGKLDIASNTTFGLGVARSGTSEVAGQIYNSNGILYLGAESSAGGQIFSGSSAYAAVIGSGANYPLQFATNNATRATINTAGELLIATTTDNGDFKLQVNGNALISGSIKTANGGSSTAVPWHLGSVVATSVQLDTNNYVEVEINGTFYRLAIVTPL